MNKSADKIRHDAITRFKLAVQDELQERIAQYVETFFYSKCTTDDAADGAKALATIIRNKDWNKEGL